jgi:hypothetical protein
MEAGGTLAGAERQQQFLADAFVHVFQLQCLLTLVAQDFEYRRPPFLGDLNPRIVQVHDMHLERLHEKILVVSAAWAGQRHAGLLFCGQYQLPT